MKSLLFTLFMLCATGGFTQSTGIHLVSHPATATLTLSVENVNEATGTIWVGIYESEEDFLDREKARLVYHKISKTGTSRINVDRLQIGKEYAIAIFHDENDNGELDTNFIGLPSEPWAFSQPLRSWFRLPRFDEMRFVFRPEQGALVLRLR